MMPTDLRKKLALKIKTLLQRYFCIIFMMWLAACAMPSSTPMASTSQSTFTTVLETPTLTHPITPTHTLPPTKTLLSSITLNGLRVAYVMDGNLFVQDSGGQPTQLTHSGLEDSFPIFSDDGEKIRFQRGKPIAYVTKSDGTSSAIPQHIDTYLINANGSQEQIIFPRGSFAKLNLGYGEDTESCGFDFMPGTHNLLFTTCQVQPGNDGLDHSSPSDIQRNKDMLILNTDTMEIKQVFAPTKGGFFHLSPNKKFDIDYTENYIDLISTSEQTTRHHMIPYLRDWDNEWTEASWSQDSSKFTFLAPMNENSDSTDSPSPDIIWQYSIDKDLAVEIRLNPPPIGDNYIFSPDATWIVYNYPGETSQTFPAGVYLGDLRDGSSHLISSEPYYGLVLPHINQWSPDSKYFFFYNDARNKMYLGNSDGDIIPLTDMGYWVGWLDSQRYLYQKDSLMMGEIGKKTAIPVLNLPLGLTDLPPKYFTYIFLKSQ